MSREKVFKLFVFLSVLAVANSVCKDDPSGELAAVGFKCSDYSNYTSYCPARFLFIADYIRPNIRNLSVSYQNRTVRTGCPVTCGNCPKCNLTKITIERSPPLLSSGLVVVVSAQSVNCNPTESSLTLGTSKDKTIEKSVSLGFSKASSQSQSWEIGGSVTISASATAEAGFFFAKASVTAGIETTVSGSKSGSVSLERTATIEESRSVSETIGTSSSQQMNIPPYSSGMIVVMAKEYKLSGGRADVTFHYSCSDGTKGTEAGNVTIDASSWTDFITNTASANLFTRNVCLTGTACINILNTARLSFAEAVRQMDLCIPPSPTTSPSASPSSATPPSEKSTTSTGFPQSLPPLHSFFVLLCLWF